MLEEKIDKLIVSIEALTAALYGRVENEVKKETTKIGKCQVQDSKDELEPVTVETLQDMCLAIVRKDRKNKKQIIKIIADYGGELLKDIDEAKLPYVKKALELI